MTPTTVLSTIITVVLVMTSPSDEARILVYPFGPCLNSHLLNAEKLAEILADAGHETDLLVRTAYSNYDHHVASKSLPPSPSTFEERLDKDSAIYSNNESDSTAYRHQHQPDRQQRRNQVKKSPNLVQFAGPENHRPVCDYDTVDFMLYAPIGDLFTAMLDTGSRYRDCLLSDRSLLSRLKDTRYNLLLVEAIDPCSRLIVDYLDVPFALLVTTGLGHFDSNPRPPSYLPAAIAPFSTNMNFGQRLANLVMKVMYDRLLPAMMGYMTPLEELRRKHRLNVTLFIADSFNRASLL